MPVCLECNKHFKLLNSHLCRTHKITTAEYKRRHGDKTPFSDQCVKDLQKKNGYSPWSIPDVMKKLNITKDKADLIIKEKNKTTFSQETSVRNVKYWIKKGFSQSDAEEKVRKVQSRDQDYFIENYGYEVGVLKNASYRKSIGDSNSSESMLNRGYDLAEIKLIRDNISIDALMAKYDMSHECAAELREKRLSNHTSHWRIDHWTDRGFSAEFAKARIKLMQIRNLKYFETKYGKVSGGLRYSKWVKAATSHSVGKFSSKESQEFFKDFIDYCTVNNIKFEEEKYFCINRKAYYVDLYIEDVNLIFEFDGSAFHPDPENFNAEWVSAKKKIDYVTALKMDNKKKLDLESVGNTVIRIYSKRKKDFNLIEIFESMKNGK